jgi:stage II sporulation protein M
MEPGTFFMFFFILVKNIGALLLPFALSPLLCLLPVASLLLNGALISLVSVIVAQEKSVGYVLSGILPHGIIEIPAYVIGQAVSISMGFTLIAAIFSARKRQQLLPVFKTNARYMIIALILLIPAAAIETFATPLLLD